MFNTFLTAGFAPFTFALALLFGLLALELAFALMGGTLLGAGGEGLDTPEIDLPDGPDIAPDLSGVDLDGIDTADLELPDLDGPDTPSAAETGGIAAWLGFGRMPAAIWLASVLMAFGLGGVTLQSAAEALLGWPLPLWLAVPPCIVLALWFARQFGGLFARLVPKTETQALSERHLGQRRGVVSQGTARRGRPAEVRVSDRYGNIHYLRAEPLRDSDEIAQGTQVLVLRHRHQEGYFLVPLTD